MMLFIPLAPMSAWQDNELRYALRSWDKHSPPDRVLIIGHKPGWYTGEHIQMHNVASKPKDIFLKTQRAAKECDSFIFANDDHFLLSPFQDKHYHAGPLASFRKGSDAFMRYVQNTAKRFPGGNYFDVHTPMVMQSDVVLSLDYGATDVLLKSTYCNTARVTGEYYADCKINTRMTAEAISSRVAGLSVFSVGDGALGPGLREFLASQYPVPSRWELA